MGTLRPLLAAVAAASALLLVSCGGDPEPAIGDGDAAPLPDDDAEPGTGDDADRGPGTSDSREVTLAVADAAQRTGVAEEAIELVELSMVTWPDGALGCPEPDLAYTQALVEGYRIILDAGGEQLVYHGALGEDPFLCEDPQAPASEAG